MTASPASVLIVTGGSVILPERVIPSGEVVIEKGIIVAVGPARRRHPAGAHVLSAEGGWIAPGFIDLHVHGGGGADFMDGTPEAIRTANRCHARHGTTTIFPTTTTGSREQITAMIQSVGAVRRRWTLTDGARIGGVHFYGPYFAEDKVGCHAPEGRRDPDPEEYREHLASGLIRIATCAAELPGAVEFYRAARRRRCLITCGHSNSSWTEMQAAFDAGMRHVDHFWCVMSSVASLKPRFGTPMQASMEQFVLAQPEMSTEVIADGCHLSDELLGFAWKMLGPRRLCLVTDASRAVDCPPGRYRFGSQRDGSWFENDGRVGRVPRSSALASSVAGMDRMVRTMLRASSAPIPDVIRMATLTPAERVGIADACGSLEPGKRADLVLLDRDWNVQRTMMAGQEFERT